MKSYLTKERYEELTAELRNLKKEGRQSVMERLRHAKEQGDLSENAEYQTARDDQAVLEKRIAELEILLKNSALFEKRTGEEPGNGVVKLGSKVKLNKEGVVVNYIIVGSSEADPLNGLISNESPLGCELLAKKSGDKVRVDTPKGEMEYLILNVN
ncbi:MAG: transcription elongation factor GreA [Minisyncoccia bacterium]